jgi:tricorn protease
VADRNGGDARRLTSTGAVESDPHFSPDGTRIAFTSDRSGVAQVYVVAADGGDPMRLTWYPSPSTARGWTPDGARVLYESTREVAPSQYGRLWTVSADGGPSTLVSAGWGHTASFSATGKQLVFDRMRRWDVEWRSYRGGQNTPLTILDLASLDETKIPNERSMDLYPVWMGQKVFFVSDRNWTENVWSYDIGTKQLAQVTRFTDVDVKTLSGNAGTLVFEQDGYIHTLDPATGQSKKLAITCRGDFPWMTARFEDVTSRVLEASLSPTGKRILMEARGEIFTVPVEKGDVRNLTHSPGAADRAPVWSPDGKQVAWFSSTGTGYSLMIGAQDGSTPPRSIAIGESKFAWIPTWSPDGSRIAFVDDDTRIRIVDLKTGKVITADADGANIGRGDEGITWSPDSRYLAYAKFYPNMMRRIVVWSVATGATRAVTDQMADAGSPAWDRNGRYLYFTASTDLALGSGWANTSSMLAQPTQGVYALVLREGDPSPLAPKSDEEPAGPAAKPDTGTVPVRIDTTGIERRIIALPLPVRRYAEVVAGPAGSLFALERIPNTPGFTVHKFTLADAKTDVFVRGVTLFSVSLDGKKALTHAGPVWSVVATDKAPEAGKGVVAVKLSMLVDRAVEWKQMFDEAWAYEKDFFYDPAMHGNDWNAVRARYRPLVEHVKHRSDLNYVLDLVNGELSVGHSFVFGGDMPPVDTNRVGLLGADLVAEQGAWRIARIYTFESWNPGLAAPLDRPGMKARVGDYIVGVNGQAISASDDPYRFFDGTSARQTVLHLNDKPGMDGSWTETVVPSPSEDGLRTRAWVEDNRRTVDRLSGGKLAYVWVPNTGGPGTTSFNRYLFAQQDKPGAVIDERFNGGGNLDDYMVDHMTRTLRAALTNEVPNGRPFRLPQGVLGPKVLLINELAGSGGDYFPWAFRQQKAGPLIGARTWGGLVKSSVHYALIDGGALTAPDNGVFDPINHTWVAENEGIPPDIEVLMDAKSSAAGRDVQLERGVQEALRLLKEKGEPVVTPPPFSKPSKRAKP